jgi:UDP-2-acetamido-2,6-beta-L-arabino-hexul-4-ose reductase
MKIKVGITGQTGFIGYHLFNYLSTKQDEIELIHFENKYFKDKNQLKSFVYQCDTIVHLAGINRHNDPKVLYETNIQLVQQIIDATQEISNKPHIIFASSIQEEYDNQYGKSKKDARLLLYEWAKNNNTKFTGLIIPNVFGPFCKPFYNSVIATFSYQLIQKQEPKIDKNSQLKLIYINELVEIFYEIIKNKIVSPKYEIKHSAEYTVNNILTKLINFQTLYLNKNIIPELTCSFDIALFNTFRSYIDIKSNPMYINNHLDNRGNLFEIIKTHSQGQIFYSTTYPNMTRGNHYHTRKIERFCVVGGKAIIKLRKINTTEIYEFELNGDNPSFIDIPIFFVHNITNIGKNNLFTLFWTNEIFNPNDTDTFFQTV